MFSALITLVYSDVFDETRFAYLFLLGMGRYWDFFYLTLIQWVTALFDLTSTELIRKAKVRSKYLL